MSWLGRVVTTLSGRTLTVARDERPSIGTHGQVYTTPADDSGVPFSAANPLPVTSAAMGIYDDFTIPTGDTTLSGLPHADAYAAVNLPIRAIGIVSGFGTLVYVDAVTALTHSLAVQTGAEISPVSLASINGTSNGIAPSSALTIRVQR